MSIMKWRPLSPWSTKVGSVVRELEHVGHRVAVAGQRELGLLVGVERGFPLDGGDDVVETGVVALDAVRP